MPPRLFSHFAGFIGLLCLASASPLLRPLAGGPGPATGEPSLARRADGTAYLTWSGPGRADGERALWLATLAPGADTWSPPRPVISTPLLMENWADFATLAIGSDGQLWAQWFQRPPGEDAHGYAGWMARSPDGGATWSPPVRLGHEFVSLCPLSEGKMLAVWLESTGRSHAGHNHTAPAPTAEPTMRLKARLLAADGSTRQDWIVDPDVCTCCQTTLARLGGDRAIVAYRGHTPAEIRDNRFALFNQTMWSRPRELHPDGWKIPACPVNGPAADTLGEAVAIAWFTAPDGVARIQAKQSRDGGLTFGPAHAIDLGRPLGRLDLVTLGDGSSVISWLEAKTEQNAAGLYVRRLFPDGRLSAPHLLITLSAVRASGFPRMTPRNGADLPVLISWTDAVPTDPANPKSTATTCVRTAEFSAAALLPVQGDAR